MPLAENYDGAVGYDVRVGGAESVRGLKTFTQGVTLGATTATAVTIAGGSVDANNSTLDITTYGGNIVSNYSGGNVDADFDKMIAVVIDGTAYEILCKAV